MKARTPKQLVIYQAKSGKIEFRSDFEQDTIWASLNQIADLFGQERFKDFVKSIIGNVFQSFGGVDVYQTLEEKASHLLYFMIKNLLLLMEINVAEPLLLFGF